MVLPICFTCFIQSNLIFRRKSHEKRNLPEKALALLMAAAMTLSLAACGTGAAGSTAVSFADNAASNASAAAPAQAGTVYKVGIVKYVDDASLDQIQKSIQDEAGQKGCRAWRDL